MGAPAGGMNAATRVAASICLNRGHTALGIRNGFSGLLRDEVRVLKWEELIGWQARGVIPILSYFRAVNWVQIEIILDLFRAVLISIS